MFICKWADAGNLGKCIIPRKNNDVNLIVEQGNSSTKVAVVEDWKIMASFVYRVFNKDVLAPLFHAYPLDKGIFSTVKAVDDEVVAYLKRHLSKFIFFDSQVKLPITVGYKTPDTLGKDRIAAVVGAYHHRPGRNLLVIDAGTCITYEILDATGRYVGGNISPGMTTRFKALNHYTSKLPYIGEAEDVPDIGQCTEEAIRAGVVNGIVFEMEGYIGQMKQKYPDIFVFLTGGHSFYFESRLKSSIFADINLVMTGLNRILEYNVEI